MKKLWRKIKAHFSGWPEGSEEKVKEEIKDKGKEIKIVKKKVKSTKIKGLNPKKKKAKGRKQGNMS